MPPKNNMTDSRVGKPDTGSPKSIAFMQQSLVSPLIMRHISQRFTVQESRESR